jgi:hypothetical protein
MRQQVDYYFYLNVLGITTLFALIPGMLVLVIYCKRMKAVDQFAFYHWIANRVLPLVRPRLDDEVLGAWSGVVPIILTDGAPM